MYTSKNAFLTYLVYREKKQAKCTLAGISGQLWGFHVMKKGSGGQKYWPINYWTTLVFEICYLLFFIWWWRKINCIAYRLLAFVIWFTFTFLFIIPWCFLRVFCIPEVLKSLNESKQWLLASSRPTKPKLILFALSISNYKLHTYIIHIYI